MQRWTKKIFISGFWGLLALTWVAISMFYYQGTRSASQDGKSITFKVKAGMTLKQVAHELFIEGIILSPRVFQAIAYIQDKETQIMVGEFSLSPTMSPKEIILLLTSGKTILYPLTIPEGYRITEIASLLETQGLANSKAFVLKTQDKKLIQSMDIPADSLEGYLFPETYYFSRPTQETKIIQKMVSTFKEKVLNSQLLKSINKSPLSLHEFITLASLIEKEAGLDSERKLISSVFHNRLRKNMRLQTDPTVIYAIKMFDGNIRKRDLKIDSPYNTYRYKGLPPGPISNPGIKSIEAAISPIRSKHLYFVSRQDGSHHFSNTLVEHNRAVKKYQLRKVNSHR